MERRVIGVLETQRDMHRYAMGVIGVDKITIGYLKDIRDNYDLLNSYRPEIEYSYFLKGSYIFGDVSSVFNHIMRMQSFIRSRYSDAHNRFTFVTVEIYNIAYKDDGVAFATSSTGIALAPSNLTTFDESLREELIAMLERYDVGQHKSVKREVEGDIYEEGRFIGVHLRYSFSESLSPEARLSCLEMGCVFYMTHKE